MKDRIFYSICFGFIFGVLLRSFLPAQAGVFVNIYFIIFILGISCVVAIFSHFAQLKWLTIVSIFIFSFSFGILKFHLAEVLPFRSYDGAIGARMETEGLIIDEPNVRENNQKLLIEEDVSGIHTKFLTTVPLGDEFHYGDLVTLSGKVEKPENFITDTGKEFDYVNYLKKDGIFYLINYGDVSVVSHGHGNYLKSILFSVKEKFLEKMNMAIPHPENLLMGGLILGEKSSFDQELRQSFVDTGTIHIVALSGYNVTIVAEWFMKLLRVGNVFPQMFSISAGIILVWLFVLMTGGSSTAMRAGIMATLALVARATGRSYDVARALILAGVVMIFLNPYVLVYDVSFQLSFIATVAVIFVAPRIEKYFMWVTDRFELRDIVTVTTAAYIFVLPFILYKMGNLSLVALPANVLILPFIPFTMMLGFATGFVGLVSYILAVPVGYVSYLFLHYELGVISFFAHLPFASIAFPNFPLILTITIYASFIYKLFGRSIYKFFTEPF